MRKSGIVTNLSFSYINLFISLSSGIFLVPYYLKNIGIYSYGEWLSCFNLLSIISLLGGGIDMVLTSNLAASYATGDKTKFVRDLNSMTVITLLLFFISLVVGLSISFFLKPILGIHNEHDEIITAFRIGLLGNAINFLFLTARSIPYSMLTNFYIGLIDVISRVFGILFLVLLIENGFGILAFSYQILLTAGISICLSVYLAYNLLKEASLLQFRIDFEDVKKQLKLVVALIAGRSGNVVVQNINLPILTHLVSPTYAAYFSITNKLYDVIITFLAPIGNSFAPYFSNDFAKSPQDMVIRFNKLSIQFFGICMISCFFIYNLNGYFISYWVGQEKFLGSEVNGLLAIAALIQLTFNYCGLSLLSIGKQNKTLWYGLFDLITRILIIAVCIKIGITTLGIPLAQIISIGYLVFVPMTQLFRESSKDFLFANWLILRYVLLFAVLIAGLTLLNPIVGIVLLVPVCFYCFKTFNLWELRSYFFK